MALSGQSTAYQVFNDTSTATSYSGTLAGVVAGELIVVVIACDGNNNSQAPSGYTVTLGSDTLAYQSGQGTSLTVGFSAIYTVVASASGDLTLSVTTTNSLRAMAAHAFRITGFDTTTPVPNAGQNDDHGSTVTSLTSPNGVTTAADGNAIIGGISIHGGTVTGLAVGSADGSTVGQTGSSGFNDCEWGVAWQTTPTAASVTFAWTWATANRPGAAWVEIAAAAGGVTGTSAATTGAATVAATGTVETAGAASVTTPAVAVTATGTVEVAGTVAVTTAPAAVSASGAVEVAGAAAIAAPAVSVAATGAVQVTGTAAVTLGAATVAASGAVGGAVSGTSAVITGAASVTASGVIETAGVAAVTTPVATVAATGAIETAGTAVIAAPAATVAASGAVEVTGNAAVTIGAATIAASGAVGAATVTGTCSVTISAVQIASAGAVQVTGAAAVTVGPVTIIAAGATQLVSHIILAARQPPTFRAIGGRGAANVPGGRGGFRTMGGGG